MQIINHQLSPGLQLRVVGSVNKYPLKISGVSRVMGHGDGACGPLYFIVHVTSISFMYISTPDIFITYAVRMRVLEK